MYDRGDVRLERRQPLGSKTVSNQTPHNGIDLMSSSNVEGEHYSFAVVYMCFCCFKRYNSTFIHSPTSLLMKQSRDKLTTASWSRLNDRHRQ